jgi:hypothetical protein
MMTETCHAPRSIGSFGKWAGGVGVFAIPHRFSHKPVAPEPD